MTDYLKGQIAEIAQINSETLLFYEKSKLIPPPRRTEAGYRLYSEAVLKRLEFIKNAKASGFTLKQIKEIFDMVEEMNINPEDIFNHVDNKIKEIESQISYLNEMKSALVTFKSKGQNSIQCPNIKALLNNFKEG